MIVQYNISDDLWSAVRAKYENGDFTGAIRDSFIYLSNSIRDKADLTGDGIDLINKAFSENSPKIKINKLETQSELDEQKGISSLFRGLYQSIRNPRSHEKIEDSEEDCISLICFIDFLIRKVKGAQGQFSIEEFLSQVQDKRFVRSEKYCSALVYEIPNRKLFDTVVAVYKIRNNVDIYNLAILFKSLYSRMTAINMETFLKMVSEDLRKTNQDMDIKYLLNIMKPDMWKSIDQVARLRTENRILESIKDSHFLATWVTDYFSEFSDKKSLLRSFDSLITEDDENKLDYFFSYIYSHSLKILNEEDLYDSDGIEKDYFNNNAGFIELLRDLINRGNIKAFKGVKNQFFSSPAFIKKYFQKSLDEFTEKNICKENVEIEDLPF